MTTLGEALYDRITNGRSPRTEPATLGAALAVIVGNAGSVAGAARMMGVPRRTFRDWISKGYAGKPTGAGGTRNGEVIRAALRIERRARLPRGRERRLRNTPPSSVTIDGTYEYRGRGGAREEKRYAVAVGDYMRPGTLGDVLDAFLDGASLDELGDTFAAGIDDPHGFYSDTLDSGHEHGWDVDEVNW